jgi:insulysin
MYLLKSLVNPEHPYARMNAGNIETLEKIPAEQGIDVGKRLFEFFKNHYLPSRAILVVTSPNDLSSLENWISPFSSTLSRKHSNKQVPNYKEESRFFPELFVKRKQISTICLFRRKPAGTKSMVGEENESLSFHWPLSFDYSSIGLDDRNVVTATQIGFVLSQILGRRGPGSLYQLLRKRSWIPGGSKGVPRISFPVDVSGFQVCRAIKKVCPHYSLLFVSFRLFILLSYFNPSRMQLMKLEISLTTDGFLNRSSVIAAVYDSINSLVPFQLRRELIAEYMTVAELYGYVLSESGLSKQFARDPVVI